MSGADKKGSAQLRRTFDRAQTAAYYCVLVVVPFDVDAPFCGGVDWLLPGFVIEELLAVTPLYGGCAFGEYKAFGCAPAFPPPVEPELPGEPPAAPLGAAASAGPHEMANKAAVANNRLLIAASPSWLSASPILRAADATRRQTSVVA